MRQQINPCKIHAVCYLMLAIDMPHSTDGTKTWMGESFLFHKGCMNTMSKTMLVLAQGLNQYRARGCSGVAKPRNPRVASSFLSDLIRGRELVLLPVWRAQAHLAGQCSQTSACCCEASLGHSRQSWAVLILVCCL